MVIKILGRGCANCQMLMENTKTAVREMRLKARIIKVQDVNEIMSYRVMRTPALVINERVVSYGRVLSVEEIKWYLQNSN